MQSRMLFFSKFLNNDLVSRAKRLHILPSNYFQVDNIIRPEGTTC